MTTLDRSAGAVAGIAALVAGIAIAIIAIGRIKDATDQWVASTDKAVAAASDLQVFSKIGQTLAENQTRLAAANQHYSQTAAEAGTQTGYMTARFGSLNGGVQRAAQDVGDLTQQQQHLIGTATTVAENLGILGQRFHVSAAGAMALANAAGVNLQQPLAGTGIALRIAEQQITNLRTGLGAMEAPIGVVGADMEAMGIQSQLASSKVQQVNQAMDQFVSTVTSGMNTLAQFQGQLSQMGHDALSSSVNLSGAISSIARDNASVTYSLKGMGTVAQQSWQQFSQAVNTGNSAIDFLRTGMAEGAVGAKSYEAAIHAVVGELLPMTQGNKTAVAELSTLAQQAGGPATTNLKTLAQWAGITGKQARDVLTKAIQDATQAMSDMSKVAQNLSATVSGQLDASLSAAILKTSNVSQATNTYVHDLNTYGAQSPITKRAQDALNTSMANAYRLSQQASGAVKGAGNAMQTAGGQAGTAAGQGHQLVAGHQHAALQVDHAHHELRPDGRGGGCQPIPGRRDLQHGREDWCYASGTSSALAGMALVGERGPELVNFRGGESVHSAAQTAAIIAAANAGGGHCGRDPQPH